MNLVTTILSDIGNVVAFYDDDVACSAIANLAGLSPDDVKDAVYGNGRDQTRPFRRFMRGDFDGDGFRRGVSRSLMLTEDLPKAEFEKAFCDIFWPNYRVIGLWRILRLQGLTITAVSNLESLRAAHLAKMGIFDVFDHRILSFQEGLLKPSEELMIRALDISGAAAEEAVFIDDKAKNLPPAEKLGIRTHCYGTFDGLLRFLLDNGVIC